MPDNKLGGTQMSFRKGDNDFVERGKVFLRFYNRYQKEAWGNVVFEVVNLQTGATAPYNADFQAKANASDESPGLYYSVPGYQEDAKAWASLRVAVNGIRIKRLLLRDDEGNMSEVFPRNEIAEREAKAAEKLRLQQQAQAQTAEQKRQRDAEDQRRQQEAQQRQAQEAQRQDEAARLDREATQRQQAESRQRQQQQAAQARLDEANRAEEARKNQIMANALAQATQDKADTIAAGINAIGLWFQLRDQAKAEKKAEQERRRTRELDDLAKRASRNSAAQESLLRAASWLDPAQIEQALKQGAALNTADSQGLTPVARAVEQGKFLNAQFLLARGFETSTYSDASKSPLFIAVERGDLKAALLLSTKGANPKEVSDWDKTPEKLAKEEKLALFVLLFDNFKNPKSRVRRLLATAPPADKRATELNEATIAGDLTRIDALLESGVAVDAPDQYSWTPLLQTVQENSIEMTRALLERGANINATNAFGQSALALAMSRKQWNIARLLLANGADVRLKDATGKTVGQMFKVGKNTDKEVAAFMQLVKLSERKPGQPLQITGFDVVERRAPRAAAPPMAEPVAPTGAVARNRNRNRRGARRRPGRRNRDGMR